MVPVSFSGFFFFLFTYTLANISFLRFSDPQHWESRRYGRTGRRLVLRRVVRVDFCSRFRLFAFRRISNLTLAHLHLPYSGFVNWRRRTVCLRCFPYAEGSSLHFNPTRLSSPSCSLDRRSSTLVSFFSGNEGTGIGLAQSAAMAAKLASLPNFNANSAADAINASPSRTQPNHQQSLPSPIAPSSTNNVRPTTYSTSSNSSSSNDTHGSPVGSGRLPSFISSGPYRPSNQQQQQVNVENKNNNVGTGVGGAVQRDVFGHVVSIQQQNGSNTRQRNASMTSGGGGGW